MRQAAPGGARASSETMAWYSQSSRKFVFAKRTHTRRAVRTMYAAVRITYRMTERMPCARAFFGSASYCTARSRTWAIWPNA